MVKIYYSNITNKELNYFKGLTVPNFTIKLSDILHKTNNEYDNKLFQIEQITTTIYRIVPMFYCEEINGTNPNDNILDDKCIIAHKEETETWFTFIGEPNNPDIQDYQNYASYYEIGDSLTMNEFNSIVSLLKHHITHNDRIRLNETVQGLYGTYEFNIEDCSFLDTGILITDETLTAEPKVRLTDNVFRWSTYTLKLTVFHYTGVNILDDIDPSDLKVVDTIEVELVFNEWVSIPIDDLEENYIISFDALVEINHDNPEIHILSGLNVYSEPNLLQVGDTSEIYGQLLDTDGMEYDIYDASGRTVYFFEKLEPTITLTGTENLMVSGGTSELYAAAKDSDGSRYPSGTTVYFFKKIEETGPQLTLTSDASILSYADGESATLTATLTNEGTPVSGETVTMKVYDSTQTTLLDTLEVTDNGDGSYSADYDSGGVGDVVIVCECMNLQETYSIEDCFNALLTEQSISNSSGTKISSVGLDTIYNIRNSNFSLEFTHTGNGVLNIGRASTWSSTTANYRCTIGYADGKHYYATRTTSSNESYGDTASTSTEYQYKLTRNGSTINFYVDDVLMDTKSFSTFASYDDWSIYSIIWGSGTSTISNIKLKPL